MRAIVIEGAGPVGQPSPDTIHHRRPACPAPTSPGGGGGGECARGKGAQLESNGLRNGSGRLANGSIYGRSRNGARTKVPFTPERKRRKRHLRSWAASYWTAG